MAGKHTPSTANLTKKFVEALKPKKAEPGTDKRYTVWDTKLTGFHVVVSPRSSRGSIGKRATGAKTFYVRYRNQENRIKKVKIGRFGDLTVEQARARAKELLGEVATGKDPAKKRDMARKGQTVAELAEEYLEKYARPRKRSAASDERYLNTEVLPAWGDRKAASITRPDVIALLDGVVANSQKNGGKGITANRLLACLQKVFRWATIREIIPVDPSSAVEKPVIEEERDRILSDKELKVVLQKLPKAKLDPRGQLAVRFLILTGQRTSEVLGAEWKEFDLKKKTWIIPAERTKSYRKGRKKVDHEVPLSPQAVNALKQAKDLSPGRFVFSPHEDKPMVRTALMRGIRRSDEGKKPVFGLDHWTIHDLRHTVTSGMTKLQIPLVHVSKVLNHAVPGVTSKVYDQHDYKEEKRAALDKWGNHVAKLERNLKAVKEESA